ncbi:hypothetical protein [Flavobacterium agrisoli]|uniref:Outer membrane protein beta-barrel domain-containing protein n=1 Tax=Flavobacterium agrisoli TaxID=2793066 RepID=A0A934PME8_9FLAO|nr:hypothetical protein [Flavobacterium agrisoli]MBK0369969.1 hypothetical protein [Flavobacterium agrisoli]
MKKINLLMGAIALLFASSLSAQQFNTGSYKKQVRINLYGAYAFEDSFDSYYDLGDYYQGQLQGGFMYGAGVEFEVKPGSFVEISYQRMDSNAPTQYYNGGFFDKYADFDVATNYLMVGGNQSFRRAGSPVEGFIGGMLGIGIIGIDNPETNFSDSATKFAWGIKGGMTYWASSAVGIKMQAQLLSVTQSVGGGVYFGTGGVSTGLSSYSSIYQFTLGGGLVFNLTN